MPTGEKSGYIVVDTLPGEVPNLPPTFTVRTGMALHLYYRWPGHRVPNRSIKAHGVDVVRGDGGFVLIPPSVHANGKAYEKLGGRVERFPVQLLSHAPPRSGKTGAGRRGVVPEGSRNDWLFHVACQLRANGAVLSTIRVALLAANAHQCSPPLDADEVSRIAKSAAEYAPGQGVQRYPRLDRLCPVCGGPMAATFKVNKYGEPDWLLGCFGGCGENGGLHLPDLSAKLGLGRAGTKEQIVIRLAERGAVAARLATAVPDELTMPVE